MKNSISLTVIILLLAVSSLSAATHYVSLGSTNPTPPYTNWATAATNIQAAVNVAAANDVVLVTDGVYPGGVSVTKPLTLLSVKGPQSTIINGGGTNRCVYLTEGASLTGFTLTTGAIVCHWRRSVLRIHERLPYQLLAGRQLGLHQMYGFWVGGGAYGGTLYNCTLTGNKGGGAFGSTTLQLHTERQPGGGRRCRRRGLQLHALQLHAERQLGGRRGRRGGRLHALQLHAERQLV